MEAGLLTAFAAKQPLGMAGIVALFVALIAALVTVVGYSVALFRPQSRRTLWFARGAYALSALGILTTFGILGALVYYRHYEFSYPFSHTGNDLHGWYRFAATWAGQEGSFLLWGAWTAVIGFLVLAKAGKYEARVMPFYVTILALLAAILLKQSPFMVVPPPSAADLAAHPEWHYPAMDGQGLNPSLVNYWMTIHPPTIFFGFASLAVPFCYAVAALLWKDYEGWMPRVMPYSLLSCATLGIGLFMGGYWAYETQGWHGFWAWDPVENASFFPWLAITALVHGAVVQKSRGGMARTNTFLGILGFALFLLGTFLTRSGALAGKDASGQMLSVHAFDNISKSGLWLMVAMLAFYGGGGLLLWLVRVWQAPRRKVTGDTLVSRDFAFFLAILLMLVACAIVTLGTTWPLFQTWTHQPTSAPKPMFYNQKMLPISLLAALLLGCVPWLAWRKTDPDTFLRKLLVPWLISMAFGFFLLIWVQGAERGLSASLDPNSIEAQETLKAWINPSVQRIAVVALATMGFLAALSNTMLAYRIFRTKKPLAAGGWLAHVGIGILIIGVIVSNTFERTERFILSPEQPSAQKFGYTFAFEKMTGRPLDARPLNPDYDRNNRVELRITPPDSEKSSSGGPTTFIADPKWFVFNMGQVSDENRLERMRWPHIKKYFGHDLYIGFADDPKVQLSAITMKPGEPKQVGDYNLFYLQPVVEPGKYIGAQLYIKTPDGKVVKAQPGFEMVQTMDDEGKPTMEQIDRDMAIPQIRDEHGVPAAIYVRNVDPGTKEAKFLVSLPGMEGQWQVALEVTFKPWINLVWIGVLIATGGTLLAMVRRALEARKITDGAPIHAIKAEEGEELDQEAPQAPASRPVPVHAIAKKSGNRRNLPTTE